MLQNGGLQNPLNWEIISVYFGIELCWYILPTAKYLVEQWADVCERRFGDNCDKFVNR